MIGTGYVGLVTGTCFAESGNEVACVDIDRRKVDALRRGEIPIYEPGLAELVQRNFKAGRLKFTTDYAEVVPQARVVFIAVGTPEGKQGKADLRFVERATEALAPHLGPSAVVVVKSTVPVGTNRLVAQRLRELTGRDVDVASNPEFLKEGAAIQDFTNPDRVVVGVSRPAVAEVLEELYQPFLRTGRRFLTMEWESAELTKYVANCMLATKISFINEMANLCERVGADINDVRRGIGEDKRIGYLFLFPGVGYGGSCFPQDGRELIATAKAHGIDPRILTAVDTVNNSQKEVLFEKIQRHFGGDLSGRVIAVWGLAFKPRTDDIREAPSLVLVDQLLAAGAVVRVHDPVALPNVREVYKDKEIYKDRIIYCDHHDDAADGADALAIVTEWNEFRNTDFDCLKRRLKQPVIFDGRNLYDPEKMREAGFYYSGIGLHAEPGE